MCVSESFKKERVCDCVFREKKCVFECVSFERERMSGCVEV